MMTVKAIPKSLVIALLLTATAAGAAPARKAGPPRADRAGQATGNVVTWLRALLELTPWAMRQGVCVDPDGAATSCSRHVVVPEAVASCIDGDRGSCVDPDGTATSRSRHAGAEVVACVEGDRGVCVDPLGQH